MAAKKTTVQSPLRRGLKALAVFSVVLFLFGGSVGFVQAEDETSTTRTVEKLVLPHPAVGQRTDYRIQFDESNHITSDVEGRWTAMELTDRTTIRYADGSLRHVFVANITHGGQPAHGVEDETGRLLYVDPGTMRLVAIEMEEESVDDGSDGDAWETQFRSIQYQGGLAQAYGYGIDQALPSCLEANPFLTDDGSMDLGGPVACTLDARHLVFQNTSGAEIIGWTQVDGQDAFQVRIVDESDPDAQIDLWYASGVPAAVRATYRATIWDGTTEAATIRLADHAVGDPDQALVGTLVEPPLAPIGSDPLAEGRWPDDSDFDTPFRLVDAMEMARLLPVSDFPVYLQTHPEAYAFLFHSSASEDDTGTNRAWTVGFRAEDPADGLLVLVQQRTPIEEESGGSAPSAPAYTVQTIEFNASSAPPPEQRPESFPSFQDSLEWSRVFLKDWGFDGKEPVVGGWVSCLTDPCEEPDLSLMVGEGRSEYSWLPKLPEEVPGTEDFGDMQFGSNRLWTVNGHVVAAWAFSWSNDVAVDGPDEGAATMSAPHSEATLTTVRWAPPTPAATGVSLGVAILSGLAYYFGPGVKNLLGFGLFSRLKQPALLNHPARRAIHDAIRHGPGIRFGVLAERTDLANGTLRHHLRMLVDAGLVTRKETNGFTCYFAPRDATPENTAKAGAVQSDGARTVMDFIQGHPGTTARSIAEATGLAVGTVGYHVKRLRDAGLIDSERDGRQVRLTAE